MVLSNKEERSSIGYTVPEIEGSQKRLKSDRFGPPHCGGSSRHFVGGGGLGEGNGQLASDSGMEGQGSCFP